jgi:PAS domain S-box-containing protein
MRLPQILMVLSILTFLSVSAGGALYYSSLRQAAFQEAEQQAIANTQLIHQSLNSLLSEHQKTVATLAGLTALKEALQVGQADQLYHANSVLDHFTATLGADVCYLMDRSGTTIASSNRKDEDSFVGKNFSFRPYFVQAMAGRLGAYLALGTTSGKRGIYHSYPVYSDPEDRPVGVAVIKFSIAEMEKALGLPEADILLVVDPQGIIFISNRSQWLFQPAWQLSEKKIAAIAAGRQFGKGPFRWIGLRKEDDRYVTNQQGNRFLMHQADVALFDGWKIFHLRNVDMIARSLSAPLLRIVGPVALLISFLVGLAVLILYQKASQELRLRQEAEQALRMSEARYRSLYHHTPAMLHSIDPEGRLLSVSDYWAESMGYRREEVIGRPLTDIMTAETRRHAVEKVMPQFFKEGFCKDVSYQFVTKNGRIIDVLLSAIADRDALGNIQRSLAVSMDVTERKRAEEALRLAKEELSRYSKELEAQVRKRTSEISAILKYTPAVVYMKDTRGRYLLVNSRFEELFGVVNEAVRGKTDPEVLPAGVARQFRINDDRVLEEKSPLHVEEKILHPDGEHIYLSVKFPIYEATGGIRGVCGIATDITALKKAQEQLRRLSGSIMANQEQERTAIARELHDELGQLLTALRMEAVWLQERLKTDDKKAAERAGAMCALIDTTIEEVRSMAIRLRPGVLDDLGLVDALEWYTNEFERRGAIACVFTHDPIPTVNGTIATAAYRIAQEALTNVARHAGAGHAEMSLRLQDRILDLSIRDDGCGFDPQALSDSEMVGLVGMRERAALVGGELTLESTRGRGTLVRFRVPLDNLDIEGKLP